MSEKRNKKSRKTLILRDLSYFESFLSLEFCGETGSRTYIFKKYHKIAWPNYEVNLIKPGKIFSKCLQTNTNCVLKIKNEFLYKNKEKLYCLDDYVDNFIEVEKGDVVKLIGVYGIYAYVIKDNNVGWIKFRYLKKY